MFLLHVGTELNNKQSYYKNKNAALLFRVIFQFYSQFTSYSRLKIKHSKHPRVH